jgi:hypothetical protein
MPVTRGKDAKGCFYRFGAQGAKYHYKAGDATGRARAKALAAKQGRAIEMRKHAAGGDLKGFVKKAATKVADAVQAAPGVIDRAKAAVTGQLGVRKEVGPNVRNYLRPDDHGNDTILQMWVAREPIQKTIAKFLNVLSLGQFNREKDAKGYDDLYHLRMFIQVRHPHAKGVSTQWHMWERNEVVNLRDLDKPNFKVPGSTGTGGSELGPGSAAGGSASMQVPLNGKTLTIGQLWANAAAADPQIAIYDQISSNCQAFISLVLRASGLETPALHNFIVQDASTLLPGYAQKIGRLTTDLAATIDRVLRGSGGAIRRRRRLPSPRPPKVSRATRPSPPRSAAAKARRSAARALSPAM